MALKINGTTIVDDSRNIVNAISATFTGTTHVALPSGTTGQRTGSPAAGMVRYNTTLGNFEGYSDGMWANLTGGVEVADSTALDALSFSTTGFVYQTDIDRTYIKTTLTKSY